MNITSDDIKRILKKEVSPNVDVDKMTDSDSWTTAGVDSLDRSSFFLTLEEELGVEIADEDLDNLDSIQDLLDYIHK